MDCTRDVGIIYEISRLQETTKMMGLGLGGRVCIVDSGVTNALGNLLLVCYVSGGQNPPCGNLSKGESKDGRVSFNDVRDSLRQRSRQ